MHAFAKLYERWAKALDVLQHPLLLGIRVLMGTQFALTGWGKLGNIEGVTKFFTSLGIPMPGANAWLVSLTELVGGVLLLLGLGSRITMIPLVIAMSVAYLTSDLDSLTNSTFLEPDPFLEAAPFHYWFAALLVLVFGPGKLSADGALGWWWKKRA